MKILLAALNAKYIHSSLSVRYLKEFANMGDIVHYIEYTINQSSEYILSDIYSQNADAVCFSCYIWNINMVYEIAENIKKVSPKTLIVLGGPEVSYDSERILYEYDFVDIIIRGEGEITFKELCEHTVNNNKPLEYIDGITYRENDIIKSNKNRAPMDLKYLPFVYKDLDEIKNKIIYYETQRGCPYSCQYCLSSVEKGVRFAPIEKVFSELKYFIDNKVKQVKFVDRTFNCNKKHAMAIWKFIIDNDNKTTNFHMEIAADTIDDDIIELLSNARQGLIQLEIGVQSTNIKTLEAIKRITDFSYISNVVKSIKSYGNIHQHLDLIAGLPYEEYESFKKSFNDVYSLEPEQLQLGFLKLLKGSGLRRDAQKYNIVYRSKSPYEVLYTDNISFNEMCKLKNIENIVETYYNSGKTLLSLKYIIKFFDSAFDFYEKYSEYWLENGLFNVSQSRTELYEIFYNFGKDVKSININVLKELLIFDMLKCDNIKSPPECLSLNESDENKKIRRKFYNDSDMTKKYIPDLYKYTPAQLSRMCRIEFFDYDIFGSYKSKKTTILFNYYNRDIINNKAQTIELEF